MRKCTPKADKAFRITVVLFILVIVAIEAAGLMLPRSIVESRACHAAVVIIYAVICAATVIYSSKVAIGELKRINSLLEDECDMAGYVRDTDYAAGKFGRVRKISRLRNTGVVTLMINRATAYAAAGEYDSALAVIDGVRGKKYKKKFRGIQKLAEVYRAFILVSRGGEGDMDEARRIVAETEGYLAADGRRDLMYGKSLGAALTELKMSADAAEHKNIEGCTEYYEKQLAAGHTDHKELVLRSKLAGLYRDTGEAEKEREQLEKIVAAKRDQLILTRKAAERLAAVNNI